MTPESDLGQLQLHYVINQQTQNKIAARKTCIQSILDANRSGEGYR